MARVVVFGSLVGDLVARVPHVPRVHETVLADRSEIHAGGKGLCQAVAASRMGAKVAMIGRVGDDEFGRHLTSVMHAEGIDHSHVLMDEAGTSLGIPMIQETGENAILGIPRAGKNLSPQDAVAATPLVAEADLLLLQNEAPLGACHEIVRIAQEHGTEIIWNPAPYVWDMEEFLPEEVASALSWLTPNEIEAGQLTGIDVKDRESAFEAAMRIRERTSPIGVIVTMGSLGSVAVLPDGEKLTVEATPISAVDTTGAGDCFTAVFGVGLAQGLSPQVSMERASVAAALATTVVGATDGMPTSAEVTSGRKEDVTR